MFREQEWRVRSHGRCTTSTSQDAWFPEPARGADGLARQRGQAVEACAGCPVRTECLVIALSHEADEGVSWGIWGGVCARDRREAIDRATGRLSSAPDIRRLAHEILVHVRESRARSRAERVLEKPDHESCVDRIA
ncbi:WhiB family transcriptional regulator [Saccharopolyspora sp. NPDC050389]|uniref:WhiB family transcriptional regulator n=1 Tax=Saccharopolyspora sp. NPDC050389 TaxID=3155516 RepID=UPI0033C12FC6